MSRGGQALMSGLPLLEQAREEIAKAIYELVPEEVAGEYVDGFLVAPVDIFHGSRQRQWMLSFLT